MDVARLCAVAFRPLVLIVDDDPDARAIHGLVLSKRGFRTMEAADGAAAIDAAVVATPDLILMDASMPSMSGPEAAQRLRRDLRTFAIPIVMLTGFSSAGGEPLAECCDVCISKPISARDLVATVTSALEATKSHR